MSRDQVRELVTKLHAAQQRVTSDVLELATFESLTHRTADGTLTVNDVLRMWSWHFWSHHRDLVMARGRLTNDNPHFHVPHHVREANEQFGRFIGELACMTDEQLDRQVPGGRSAREVAEHVLHTLEDYFVAEIRRAEAPNDKTR